MTLAVLYEHPEWFKPLFAALDRRPVDYVEIDAASLWWSPEVPPPFDTLLNRMSPSSFLRGHRHAIHAAQAYLAYCESHGVTVVNGPAAYALELSKSAQIDLLRRVGAPHPRTRVVNHADRALVASADLRFPIVVKPNIGGSGALIQRFDSPDQLRTAVEAGALDLGIDSTALVQELVPGEGGTITRIELLAGEPLYAIRVTPPSGHGFNLCPADICQDEPAAPRPAAAAPDLERCPTKPAMRIEAADVPPDVVRTARRIAAAGGLDVCGIEYLVDGRDGKPYFYDINALSNFVTDAERIVGFDPFERLVDYLCDVPDRVGRRPVAAAG